ncbi:hypothetical protein A8950_3029 [Dongia mobilis]|uniref:DUF5666 domain-containing protein n=1 Tax=Dongia mobilis TaxID=578943 RepID=A0A4R6WU98_9PROT|nr:DUF6152 family protein [Dongia mobilis]TDQ80498.1 hypothetical protein A8950_3029 [Dongia mobilis]
MSAARSMPLRLAFAGPAFAGLVAVAAAMAVVAARPVLAHHGWSWAEAEQSTLTGTIKTISMDPPHPGLVVTAADGTDWQIDLGNPRQTERSGFTGATARPGDAITVLGNRSRDSNEMLMKAVRITVGGKNYDMYPERIKAD